MVRATAEFDGTPASVPAARAFARQTVATWGLVDPDRRVELLTSEIATNAVRHARTAFRLSLEAEDETVRISVHDGSAVLPTPGSSGPRADSGRGLLLVGTMAESWGIEDDGSGKAVWFTVRLAPEGPEPS